MWREVIEREGIPECPDDMSEPSYLALLYDEDCMVRQSFCIFLHVSSSVLMLCAGVPRTIPPCRLQADVYASTPVRGLRKDQVSSFHLPILLLVLIISFCSLLPKSQVKEELAIVYANAPRHAKAVAGLLPGYDVDVMHGGYLNGPVNTRESTDCLCVVRDGLLHRDACARGPTVEENSLVLQSDLDALIDGFNIAKRSGCTALHSFIKGREFERKRRNEVRIFTFLVHVLFLTSSFLFFNSRDLYWPKRHSTS